MYQRYFASMQKINKSLLCLSHGCKKVNLDFIVSTCRPLAVPQIPRILNPIAEAVRSLEEVALDPVLGHYVDVGWGGVNNAKMAILSDFFKVLHVINNLRATEIYCCHSQY